MSIYHKALDLFKFDYEITLESVPVTNKYRAMRVKRLTPGNNGSL